MWRKTVSLSLMFVALVLLASCDSGLRSSHYKALDEAKRSGAIDKGWLPEFLPQSASDIQEIHHVELDRIRVEFSFTNDDLAFLSLFSEAGGPQANRLLKELHLNGWSKLDNKSNLRVYLRNHGGETGYLVVDFSASRAQYWEMSSKPKANK